MTRCIPFLIIIMAVLNGCMKNITYESYQIETFLERTENIQLEFTTDKGQQTAFYIPPLTIRILRPLKLPYFIPV